MKVYTEWGRPVALKDGARQNYIYVVDLEKLPDCAGVYVFGRRWGKQFEALYVGKGQSIRCRVKGQMNNLKLMQRLKAAKAGKRVIMCGSAVTKQGQNLDKCVALTERALIRYFISEGHDLVNVQGTQLREHELVFSGNHPKKLLPSPIYLEKAKG